MLCKLVPALWWSRPGSSPAGTSSCADPSDTLVVQSKAQVGGGAPMAVSTLGTQALILQALPHQLKGLQKSPTPEWLLHQTAALSYSQLRWVDIVLGMNLAWL